MYHQRVFRTELLQYARQNAAQIAVEHADQLVFRAGGIGHRAQDIENRAESQCLAYGGDVAHGGVMVLGKHEADAAFGNLPRNGFGRRIQRRAQLLQHIGRTAGRRYRTPAVFRHLRPCGGRHKHGCGGNIEGFGTVAARADNVHQMRQRRHGHFYGKFAHHAGGGGNFRHGFHFNAQADQNAGNLFGQHFAAHDLAHQILHFIVKQFVVVNQP